MTEPIKWRDVRKVKPRLGEYVMIKPRSMRPFEAQYVKSGCWERATDQALFTIIPTYGGSEVTHWAPMPKGPRGKR